MTKLPLGLNLNRIGLLVTVLVLAVMAFSSPGDLAAPLLLVGPVLGMVGQFMCLHTPACRGLLIASLTCSAGGVVIMGGPAVGFSSPCAGQLGPLLSLLGLVLFVAFLGQLGAFLGQPALRQQALALVLVPLFSLLFLLGPELLGPIVVIGVMTGSMVAYSGLLGRLASAAQEWEIR